MRQNTNDLEGLVVKQKSLADGIWVAAKTSHPVRMTENQRIPAIRAVVLKSKYPTEVRTHPHRVKKIMGDA